MELSVTDPQQTGLRRSRRVEEQKLKPYPLKNVTTVSAPKTLRSDNREPISAKTAMRKEWETRSNFVIGKPLGRGAFGHVYLARTKKEKFIFALKVLQKEMLMKHRVDTNIRREIEIGSRLVHPNILRLYGYYWDDVNIYLMLEFAPNGDIFGQLRSERRFSEPVAASYVAELTEALIYCHSLSIIHRDIKPENLLIGGHGELKLADFGWSVHAPSTKRRTVCGTSDYFAPELVDKIDYDATIDIWCVGVLLYEFLVGKPPFESPTQDDNETYGKIRRCKYEIPTMYVSAEPARLIRAMLQRAGKDRLPLELLARDPWIVNNRVIRDGFDMKLKIDHQNEAA